MVATNRHVAMLDLSEVPARFVPQGSVPEIEAVFRSGQGPSNEQSLPAQILAADTSDDVSTDLAFLLVKGLKRPPTPLNVLARSDTTEGMAYTGGLSARWYAQQGQRKRGQSVGHHNTWRDRPVG